MALIPVTNNYTGDEGMVDETWLDRWPDDFTRRSEDDVPPAEQEHINELHAAGANEASETAPPTTDSVPKQPAARRNQPSDGTSDKDN